MFSNVVRSGGWRDGGGCGGRRSFLVEREAPGTSRVAAPWSDGRRRTTKSKDQAPSVGWLACNEQRRGRVKRTSVLVGRSARGRTITVKQVSRIRNYTHYRLRGLNVLLSSVLVGWVVAPRVVRLHVLGRRASGRRLAGARLAPPRDPWRDRDVAAHVHARDRHPADPSGR